MSHNKKYKKYKTKVQKFISSTLDATEKKMISEITPDYWDTTGMKIKPWTLGFGNGSAIVGKMVETEPIKINNDNDTINI